MTTYTTPIRIKKYNLVRRGQRYCVRMKGNLDFFALGAWARTRNIWFRAKNNWNNRPIYDERGWLAHTPGWDFDIVFNTKTEALTFIMAHE